MKLLIHEHRTPGHFLHHVALIAEAALARGLPTELSLSAAAPATPEYQLHIAPLAKSLSAIHLFDLPKAASPAAVFAASGRACLNTASRCGAQHIIVPSADGVAPIWGRMALGGLRRLVPAGAELEVGLIRPTFAHGEGGLTRRAKLALIAAAIARAPIDALRIADFPAYENLKKTAWARRQRLLAVPEPCEPAHRFTRAGARTGARALLGLPDTGALLVAPGEISGRKCPLELAAAFAHAAPHGDTYLVFAGKCMDGLANKLATQFGPRIKAGQIIILDRLLNDMEFDAAIAAADIVVAAYAGHPGPSGIVDRAMMLDKPVIAHDYGWSAYMVDRFALGWKTNPLNPAAYASTLAAALAGAAAFKPSPATQWLKQFYSMENFKRHWMLRLRQRMGLPAEELVLWADAPPG